jgi:hypothetical protein
MSRTSKHPPKPDRFTKKHRTSAHQARTKRAQAGKRDGRGKTCSGHGWITSGVGHFGEQKGGHKDVMARCEHCLGLGVIEIGER